MLPRRGLFFNTIEGTLRKEIYERLMTKDDNPKSMNLDVPSKQHISKQHAMKWLSYKALNRLLAQILAVADEEVLKFARK
jgi:phosphopantetheinyl transferase (holo-ACP synthase)